MKLDVRQVLEEAVNRTFSRNGLMLLAAFLLLNLTSYMAGATSASADTFTTISQGVLSGIALFGFLAATVVSLRVFASDETETIPDEMVTRNLGPALLHLVVGGILFGIGIAAGLVLLVIPAIYLMTVLFFWTMYVAIEDESFLDAMKSSWHLTEGHRWRVLGLMIVLTLVNIVLIGSGILTSIGGGLFGEVALEVLTAISSLFALAVEARAFVYLAE